MPVVHTSSLSKRYGQLAALADCNLTVEAGEVFGLLGPNGAGKSTLIRILMGFLRPTAGSASVDGYDCRRQSLDVRRRVAYLPGEVRLFYAYRGDQVLNLLAQLHPGGCHRRALDLASRLDLDLSRRVSACSSGMRQKLALAAVFSIDAPVLILDEPTTHLDPTARHQVSELVNEARAAGRTVLFSSHVISEVEQVSQRVAVLRKGELVHTEDIAQLRRKHRIRAQVDASVSPPPESLAAGIENFQQQNGTLQLDVAGELPPLFGWLATLPIREVQIEPVGLKTVYDRYHMSPE